MQYLLSLEFEEYLFQETESLWHLLTTTGNKSRNGPLYNVTPVLKRKSVWMVNYDLIRLQSKLTVYSEWWDRNELLYYY